MTVFRATKCHSERSEESPLKTTKKPPGYPVGFLSNMLFYFCDSALYRRFRYGFRNRRMSAFIVSVRKYIIGA